MRVYDPRLGRFLSEDPLTKEYPFYTPYQFASNSPILAVDLDGLESSNISNETEKKSGSFTSRVFNALLGTSQEGLKLREGVYKSADDAATGTYNFFARDAYKSSTYKEGAINAFSVVTSVAPEYQSAFDQAASMYGVNLNIAGRGDAIRKSLDVSKWDAENWGYAVGSLSISIFGPPATKAAGGFALGQLGRAGGFVFGKLASAVTTSDGFLFGGVTIKSPFTIGVQRFGNMSLNKPDFWGLRIGKGTFVNRTFAAIKTEWNPLTQYTSGVIPKGTPMKFGIIGPQPGSFSGGLYLGGSLQFIVDSKAVINQATTTIAR